MTGYMDTVGDFIADCASIYKLSEHGHTVPVVVYPEARLIILSATANITTHNQHNQNDLFYVVWK